MDLGEIVRLAWGAVTARRMGSLLTILGIVIGIASVTLLTAFGEGTRRFILAEFTQFGTNILTVTKGKTSTTGAIPGITATVRKLTIEDSEALRRVPGVERVLPGAYGTAVVRAGNRTRRVLVGGVTSQMPEVFRFGVRLGRFLPAGDPRRGGPFAVLGPKLKQELFGEANPLGERVRVAGRRFVVVGVMEPKGQILGFDMDDRIYIPVASAQSLFNQDELSEIHVLYASAAPPGRVKADARRVLMERHGGEEDFTVTTETEMLDTLGRILSTVGFAVAGIGAISLVVGAIGILTMMWIAVGERTAEIGLVRAVGATRGQVLRMFLAEAAILSCAGGVLGIGAGIGAAGLIRAVAPRLPLQTSPGFVAGALGLSLAVGLLSGVLPARRAATLDPLEALRAE